MKIEFDHVAVRSKDIQASIAFYKEHFDDVEVLYEDKTWGLIRAGGAKVAFVTAGEHPPHFSFSVRTKEELVNYAAEMNGKIKVHRDRSESFYFKDPSDNAIEIVWYPE